MVIDRYCQLYIPTPKNEDFGIGIENTPKIVALWIADNEKTYENKQCPNE